MRWHSRKPPRAIQANTGLFFSVKIRKCVKQRHTGRKNMKKSLAVLFGGCSSEYEVSLHSAAAVLRAVDTENYELAMVGITRMGQWLYYTGDIDAIEADAWHKSPACVRAVLSPSREDHGLWLMKEEGCELKTIDLFLPVLHGKTARTARCRACWSWRASRWWAAGRWRRPCVWIRTSPTGWLCRWA